MMLFNGLEALKCLSIQFKHFDIFFLVPIYGIYIYIFIEALIEEEKYNGLVFLNIFLHFV